MTVSPPLSSIERPKTPNTALYAPEGVEMTDKIDGHVPDYPVAKAKLMSRACQIWSGLKHVSVETQDEAACYAHFIQKTPLLKFKDDIHLEFLDRGEGKSSFIIYSASRVGKSDLGTNRKRVESWLQQLNDLSEGA